MRRRFNANGACSLSGNMASMLGRVDVLQEPDADICLNRTLDTSEIPSFIAASSLSAEDVYDVGVIRWAGATTWAWTIECNAMDQVRTGELANILRQRIIERVELVPGVRGCQNQDTETLIVDGSPDARSLLAAAAEVIDELAERIANHRHDTPEDSGGSPERHAAVNFGTSWKCSCGAGGEGLSPKESQAQFVWHCRQTGSR